MVQITAIIGHRQIVELLEGAVTRDRLAHAYLFIGPSQVGKRAVAVRLARELLAVQNLETSPDYYVLERERDAKTGKLHGGIVIDQVHALTGRLAMGSFGGTGYKICVIDGADTFTTEAANALLKTLEEPRPKTVLILLAESDAAVLPTIKSRCQVLRFGRVPTEDIAAALAAAGVPASEAAACAALSGGRPGRAIGFVEHPESLMEMRVLRSVLLRLPSLPVSERWSEVERLIPAKTAFQEAGDLTERIADLIAELVHDALLVATGAESVAAGALMHPDAAAEIKAWAMAAGTERLAAVAERIGETRDLVAGNVNPRTALERLVLGL